MTKWSFLPVFLLIGVRAAWIEDRPVFETRDGNLVIASAKDRNITLLTSGSGAININDINLMDVSEKARKAVRVIEVWENGQLSDLTNRVIQLENNVNGGNGLETHLAELQMLVSNRTNPPSSSDDQTQNVSMVQLASRVLGLEIMMATLKGKLMTNKCSSSPCQNGGTCIRIYDGVQCLCPPNYEGEYCEEDVDECFKFANTDLGCQNGATCRNLPGSYRCDCAPGWHGTHCVSKTGACDTQNSRELCGNGICAPSSGHAIGYRCICEQGWQSEGLNPACIKDVDECAANHPACSMNPVVPCINLPGSYTCGECPTGYTGNGYYCTDIDECDENNGGCSTLPKAHCINTVGSRVCVCPFGYQGDGITCTYMGVCSMNNGGCHPIAGCIENIDHMTPLCVCPTGYHGDGVGPYGCKPDAVNNLCSSNPCSHGLCESDGKSFQCTCDPGYTGTACDTVINPCAKNPCQNNGLCRSIDLRRFSCECTDPFTGATCESQRDTCHSVITTPSGSLMHPMEGQAYKSDLYCSFVIITNKTSVLKITFTRFDLESTVDCVSSDFLQIHDGPNSQAYIKGRFCGSRMPFNGTFTTTHNSIYMGYKTISNDPHTGFAFEWETVAPTCGGIFNTDHGIIKSPDSRVKYLDNRDCMWEINVRPGKRILFHFITMMIKEHPTCDYSYLQINETVGDKGVQLGFYCNHLLPDPLLTTGSFAKLYFHFDESSSDDSFLISYSTVEGTPGCGGVFTGDQGTITTPGYPSKYPPNMICEYKIQLSEGARIRFTWVTFEVDRKNPGCSYDSVQIFNGTMNSPVGGKHCGDELPSSFAIDTNVASIVFTSDSSFERRGFQLKYEAICGGYFYEPSGALMSLYYPKSYPSSRTCIYKIIQPPGRRIILTMVAMEINGRTKHTCTNDYLAIYDGDNENSTLLGSLCGNAENIQPFYSTHNFIFLKFVSDINTNNRGFLANYTTVDNRCGGLLRTPPAGIIQPFIRGENYRKDVDCIWTLEAPRGYIVELTFGSFQLENHFMCQSDYVEIYDGAKIDNKMIGQRRCGRTMPPQLQSQGETMTIVSHTDKNVFNEGFIAHYRFSEVSKSCGGHFKTVMGTMQSPNYPENYTANRECVWIITAPSKKQINLEVETFDLEDGNCMNDYLELRNGAYETSPLIGRYCGRKIVSKIKSSANHLYVKFVSDDSTQRSGFSIKWESTTSGCGGILTGPHGEIHSPGYPQSYYEGAKCNWKIAVAKGNAIRLKIHDLDFNDDQFCLQDYLQITTGHKEENKNGSRYCNNNYPSVIDIPSNLATVQFTSLSNNTGRGFALSYETNCVHEIQGTNGVIESPGYPDGYPSQLNCTWNIEALRPNIIKIAFSHFNLGGDAVSAGNCSANNLTIEQGEGVWDVTKLATFCNSDIPPDRISSTKRQVFLHLATDRPLNGGFRLEWLTVGCNARLNKPSGIITSPGYPVQYPTNVECEWLIEIEEGYSVEITFIDVKLHKSDWCDEDRIEIYGGTDANAPKLGQLCNIDKMTKYTSPDNTLFVKFESDVKYTGKGFKAEYKSIKWACGGSFQANDGAIHSPNYPNDYPTNSNCQWLIEVDKHHVVKLDFGDFDVVSAGNCTDNYVKIFDGPTHEHELLGTFCSNNLPVSIKSSRNSMLVVFKSSSSLTSKGFRAQYTKACGARIVTDGSGILEISSFPDMSSERMDCTWIVVAADPEDHITLNFFHVNIVNPTSQLGDVISSISVYEGEGIDGPNLGTWSSNKVPVHRTSTGNALTIHVVVSSLTGSYGFGATYSVLNSACGGEYLAEDGSIASPGYPNSYPTNVECIWLIKTSPGNPMYLSRLSVFELEPSLNCDHDYLEIREESGVGKLIGIYCANEAPEGIKFSKDLWIKFRSDGSGTAKGFIGEFFRGSIFKTELTGASGEVTSPLYPRYWRDGYHQWKITVDVDSVIHMEIDEIDMEFSDDYGCGLTYLSVFDGNFDGAPGLASICTSTGLGQPITTTGNVMYITFESMQAQHGSLFRLHWYAVPKELSNSANKKKILSECMVEYNMVSVDNKTVIIASPGWPDGYASNLKCTWVFMSPPGYHLVVHFMTIDLGVNPNCTLDHVSVYNGNGLSTTLDESHLLKKVCKSNEIYRDIVGKNEMTVEFHSGPQGNATGFQAWISRECGGELSGPHGMIDFNVTMNMHNGPDHLYTCEWNITVRTGRTIEVEFTDFVGTKKNGFGCGSNYVLLKNGAGPDSPNLGPGKICGTEARVNSLETTGNKLYVKATGYRGQIDFKMTYREKRMACGGYYEMTSAEKQLQFNSPNYPNIPPSYSDCIWVYRAPVGERLTLRFIEKFDLTSDQNCAREYVEVRDGGTELSQLLGRFCGTTIPGSLRTTSDMIYVQFYTEMHDPSNGFKASVTTGEICGGTVIGASGIVTSPNYPKSYSIGQQCDWWIIGPIDHVLKLEFNDIHLSTSEGKCNDFINISEPELTNSQNTSMMPTVNPSRQFCGNVKPEVLQTSSNKALVTFHSDNERSKNYRGFSLNFTASKEECGGSLTGIAGEFQSIGYPKLYEYSRRHCEWVIEVPEGSHVVLEILDLDTSLDIGYLMIANDKRLLSKIYTLREFPLPNEIVSTSNTMYVILGISEGHRGLKARFTAVSPAPCGGIANDASGILHLPPSPYRDSDFRCRWKLEAPDTMLHDRNGTTLTVTISGSMGNYLHPSKFCEERAKFITIEDGEKNIAMICGNVTSDEPYVVRSATPSNIIDVMNGTSAGRMNFNVHYEWTACGGILNGPSHTIRSPDKVKYPKSCAWHVKNDDPGSVISMKFTRMNLGSCDKGYIIVRNGGRMGPQMHKYCGNTKPIDIISSTNQLWIEFWAAEPPGDFEIQLNSPSGGCGGVYRDSKREIATPNFPKPYPNNAECTWEITANPGNTIELSLVNRFRLETSNDCAKDFVQMFDWKYDKHGIGAWKAGSKYCGQNVPMPFNTTSNRMKMLFRSNDGIQMDGFQAIWKTHCGGIFEASGKEQYFATPSYPDNYPPNLTCNYTFVPPKSKWVYIEFLDFELESDPANCRYDNVTILYWYPSGYYNKPVLCGGYTPELVRSDRPINIVFRTDSQTQKRGFRLKYYTYECGGEITKPTVITPPSLKHRKSFEYDVNCTWIIKAPEGKRVVLRFQKLDLAISSKCISEKLVIVEGESLMGMKRGRFCGKTDPPPAPVMSIGNAMTVMYKLATHVDPGSLEASIVFANNEASGCGGRISLQNSTIFRTQKNTVYDPLEECHWTVTAGSNKNVRLTITQIDLKNSINTTRDEDGCTGDFLEVRDGGPEGEMIGRYCGDVKPQPITSTMHVLWIRFVTDGIFEGKGVTATLDPIDSPCGEIVREINSKTQILTVDSPGYPSDFPAGIQCRWIFRKPDSTATLRLHFWNLDMEDTEFCAGDHIQITDEVGSHVLQNFGEDFVFYGKKSRQRSRQNGRYNAIATYKYCGQANEIDYYGESNEIQVLLKTTADHLPKPRKFKFEVATASCNRNYTAEQGRIVHKRIGNCTTTITAPPNHTISLYINKIFGYGHHHCPTNFFKIHDGNSNGPVIYDVCGDTRPSSIYSTGNLLSIRAETTFDPSDKIFQQYDILYTTSDKGRGCGGKLFNYEGVFTSPMVPNDDRISRICEWEISVPRGYQVSLNFELFELGWRACDKDYLQVIESKEGGRDETYCSGATPAPFEATTNVVKVIYSSSNNDTELEWRIRFQAVQRTDIDVMYNNYYDPWGSPRNDMME